MNGATDGTLKAKIFSLPLPPSTNGLFVNGWVGKKGAKKLRRIPSKPYKAWREVAGWALKSQDHWHIGGAVNVAIYLPAKMQGDVDNRIKAVLDLLVKYDRIDDDRNVRSLSVARSEKVALEECQVYVEAAA